MIKFTRFPWLDLHLAWVEDVDCHRCLEVRLYDQLRPLLNRRPPSRCTTYKATDSRGRDGASGHAVSPGEGLVRTFGPSNHSRPQSQPQRGAVPQKEIDVTKTKNVKPGRYSDRLTYPSNYRDGYPKGYLWGIWCEHGDDAVTTANAAFGTPGAPFARPLKQATLNGWFRDWRWWRDEA